MRINIEVPSSSSDAIYLVSVDQDDQGVVIACSCPAGAFGKLCKHKLDVLDAADGSVDSLSNSSRSDVRRLIEGTAIPLLVTSMKSADLEVQKAKRVLESLKRALEKALNSGRNLK